MDFLQIAKSFNVSDEYQKYELAFTLEVIFSSKMNNMQSFQIDFFFACVYFTLCEINEK